MIVNFCKQLLIVGGWLLGSVTFPCDDATDVMMQQVRLYPWNVVGRPQTWVTSYGFLKEIGK